MTTASARLPEPTMAIEPISLSLVIPAYKRYEPLVWTIASALRQRFEDVPIRRARLTVVNNGEATKPIDDAVAQAVAYAGQGAWDIRVIHRRELMEPVFSWYEGIREFTEPGEIVVLNGDDDVLLQNSIAIRASAMAEHGADFLLSSALGNIIYRTPTGANDLRANYADPPDRIPTATREQPRPLVAPDLSRLSSPFISAHVYRNSPALWRAYDAALDLMRGLPVSGPLKFTMLPQFLAITLMDTGNALASDMRSCIRGGTEEEMTKARFGRTGWHNPGFYFASALYVLSQSPLRERPEFDTLRSEYRGLTLQWLAFAYKNREYWDTVRPLGLVPSMAMLRGSPKIVRGLIELGKSVLGINGLRLRRQLAADPGFTFDEFFANYG